MHLIFQLYPVEEVLNRHKKGSITGPALIAKLNAGGSLLRPEHIAFVKWLSKYLMKSALE